MFEVTVTQGRGLSTKLKLVLLMLLTLAGSSKATAQDSDEVEVCQQYYDFLEGTEPQNTHNCDEKTEFLMSASQMPAMEFLDLLKTRIAENSLVRWNIAAIESAIFSGPAEAPQIVNHAGNISFFVFRAGGDHDRATAYSAAIHAIELFVAYSICGDLEDCSSLFQIVLSPHQRLFELGMDEGEYSPLLVLVCMTRFDNFQVPVGDLLRSKRMSSCLTGNELLQQ